MISEGTRLNKFLASCGIGSRRSCDSLIQEGGVTLNGESCTNPATRVRDDDVVRLDGKRVSPRQTTTILFKKPRGYVCSKHDELGRATIYELLPPKFQHLNHVGRLDRDSEGLLVLTNDGELANRLTHPSNKVEKEYRVTLAAAVENHALRKLIDGVHTPEGRARAKTVKRLSPRRVSIVLETGLKRQIREMFKTLGGRVEKLFRIRIGRLTDPDLPLGRWRHLEHHETEMLHLDPPRRS
ncbi:MAG: rRNA pseudouridine synthase [Roseibacillus sp.]|nr:rRNA pseudouridine synthase [Roseibacillus sp.]